VSKYEDISRSKLSQGAFTVWHSGSDNEDKLRPTKYSLS